MTQFNLNMLATFQSLWQELIDEIVGYLQDDKISLLASSLTCRSLVPGCQKALFSNLCVGSPSAPSGGLIVTNNLQRFLKMMEMVPHVAAYTKTLKLTLNFLEEALHERLVTQLASFHRLTHFSLHLIESPSYFVISPELKSSIQIILSLRTLEHLEVHDVLADILPQYTSIKHLVVHLWDFQSRIEVQPRTTPPRADGESSMAIESLDLHEVFGETNISLGIDYVLDTPTLNLSKLKRLQIDIEGMEDYDQHTDISRLLQACTSIEVLRLILSIYSE